MKTAYSYKRSILLFSSVLLLAGCQDITHYEEFRKESHQSDGPPEIEKVTLYTERATPIASGNLSQIVLIQGKNLSDVRSVRFNDVEVDLEEIYAASNLISVPIPRKMPGDVTDKITVKTARGEASTDFRVNIPDLVVDGFVNEFCLPDDTTQILGANFDLYGLDTTNAVVTLGELPVQVVASDESSLTIWIPREATKEEALLSISSPEVETPVQLNYRHSGILMNTDNTYTTGSEFVVKADEIGPRDVPVIAGDHYVRVIWSLDPWGWGNEVFGFDFKTTDPDILNNLDTYDVKFEMATDINHPIGESEFYVRMNWAANDYLYFWNKISGGTTFNTYGQWRTFTFDAVEMLQSDMQPHLGENNRFDIFLSTYGSSIDYDFYMCNFRLVKKAAL